MKTTKIQYLLCINDAKKQKLTVNNTLYSLIANDCLLNAYFT